MSREDILQALREDFRENTRERLGDMTVLLDFLQDQSDSSRLKDLQRHFHGLAGLGGTYGYGTITALSREGLTECERALDDPISLDHARVRQIVELIALAIEEAPNSE